jgi:ribosomal protein S18 acetylase RimI-like enzyme
MRKLPPELRIRPFRPDDAATVNRIAVAAWDQYREVFTDWPHTGPNFAATAELAQDVDLLVAEDSEIRGFVGYAGPGRPRERIFERDWAIIRMLSVDPPARGRGIGRRLTEACIARARQDSAPIIALHTSIVMQAALAIYAKLGFRHHRNIVDRHGIHYALYVLPLGPP